MNTTMSTNGPVEPKIYDWEKTLLTTGLILLSILTFFGNILVVVSFYTYRPLRSLTNRFIVSLAISDILVAVLNMPVWIAFGLNDMNFGLHGGKLLKAWTCFDIMFGVASILNLTAITVDRYIHITKPLTHQKLITKSRVTFAIIFIWFFSCALSLMKGLYWDWKRGNYELLIFCLGFLFPVIIIIFCYVYIYVAVCKQLSRFPKHSAASKQNNIKKDMKAIKTIAIVILAFIICWCPFFILNVIHGWCNCVVNQHVITFAKWLHYCNSALNPIIYACFNKDYRKGFKNALYKYASSNESQFNAINSLIKHKSFRESYNSTGDQSKCVNSVPPVPRKASCHIPSATTTSNQMKTYFFDNSKNYCKNQAAECV